MIDRARAFLGASFALLLLTGALLAPAVQAQEESGLNLSAFEPIDFPDPNRYRAADGRPGADYWQNEADYRIDVSLDPSEHRIDGEQTITYTNNAPQELNYLWVQLDQNLFKPDSRGASVVPPDARFSGFFEEGGYDLSDVMVTRGGASSEANYTVDGTRMRITLDEPLPANGGTLQLSLDFSFIIPEYGADRHGRLDVNKGIVYELAQWYPRMFVYDDVDGWNALPYLGQGEYYLEYGTFEMNITVPRDFVVTASGTLQNPGEVLTDEQRARLDRARKSRETVHVITEDEAGTEATRPEGDGPLTWRYVAENVRDVAWAASDAFIWDAATASTGEGSVLAMSLYPEEGLGTSQNPGWERSTEYVQHSVEHYSENWTPYPYPVAINVAGIVGGMEYPQIMFCSVRARGRGLFGVTDHEFGHTWFPMVVGSDERRHVWMDEGLNTFMNQYSTAAFYGSTPEDRLRALSRRTVQAMQGPGGEQPSTTYADRIRREALGFLAYRKPAAGLMLLREVVVGPELFDDAFQAYIDRWAYKHPQPADFFRTLEDVTGEDLDWFVRSWFYETDVLDHAVEGVDPSGDRTTITVASRKELMLPMPVTITFADGSTASRRIPVETFYTTDTHRITVPGEREVTKVEIDADRLLPDVNRGNNTWSAPDAASGENGGADASGR